MSIFLYTIIFLALKKIVDEKTTLDNGARTPNGLEKYDENDCI